MIIERNVGNINVEVKNFRVGLMQCYLCLGNKYAAEAKYGDLKVDTLDARKTC